MPESLLRIHFPSKATDPKTAKPWYWYYNRQQPMNFAYLAPPHWGPGWVRAAIYPVIKILAIDTQPIVPFPAYGFTSLENAIAQGDPDGEWGRLDFRSDLLWQLILGNGEQNPTMPTKKPLFNQVKGLIKARDSKTNINAMIQQAAKQFEADYSGDAADYNSTATTSLIATAEPDQPAGFHYNHVHGRFAVEQPDGPPTTFALLPQQLGAFHLPLPLSSQARYLSSLPVSACFNFNTINTSAYAYTLKVAQLDDKKWNMSVFPPVDSTIIGNGHSSANSKDYSGFGITSFPLFNPSG